MNIWFKLSRSSTGGNQTKSSEQQTTPDVIPPVNDCVTEETFKCFDAMHINRSTAKVLLNEMIEQVKCTRTFGFLIKPDTLAQQKLRICIEVIQSERSLFLIVDYDHLEDFHTYYASSIREIFRVVFRSSNRILTCGNLGDQLKGLSMFKLFSYDQIMRAYLISERNTSRNEPHDPISDQAKRFLNCICTHCRNS